LGPARDPDRTRSFRVPGDQKHTDFLCWVWTKGRGALFGSTWRGPRVCGHAHTGSGQAPRVARRRVSSCKRSVLRPVGVATDERELELRNRSGVAEPSTRCTQPPHFLHWCVGANRFLFFCFLSDCLAQTGDGSAVVENRKAAMDSKQSHEWMHRMHETERDRGSEAVGFKQEPWERANRVCLTLCCGVD
jgi:hypothetical protein